MKIQRIIRVPMIVIGLGVALLLASPVRAQQDTDPDTFDVNPGTPNTEMAAAVPVAAPAQTSAQTPDSGMALASFMPASNWDGSFAAPLNAVDVAMVVILAGGTALVALYVVTATRRQRRRLSPERSTAYPKASGATTH